MNKISVVIATYNGANFIQEQLQSILDQTMAVDEVIIQDDLSKDNTKDVLTSFIRDKGLEDKFHFLVNEHNLGYASNFVTALKKATGDYVFFCDQDDIWVKDRVENMVSALESDENIGMIGSEFEPFKCSDDAPDVPGWELAKFKNDGSVVKLDFNSENIFIGCQGCTMAMKRSFLDEVIGCWYQGWAHDEFVWKLALAEGKLYFYHKITLKRRLHSSNVTLHKEHKTEQRLKYLHDLKKSHEKTKDFLDTYVRENIAIEESELSKRIRLLDRHIRATALRIELIENKKYLNVIKLLGYIDCYHKARSIPVELVMALR